MSTVSEETMNPESEGAAEALFTADEMEKAKRDGIRQARDIADKAKLERKRELRELRSGDSTINNGNGGDSASREVHGQEQAELRDVIRGLGTPGSFKIYLSRLKPSMYKGVKVDGTLDTYTDPIDEEFIQQNHGGGDYNVKIHKRNASGTFVYFTQRKVSIAGPPKISGLLTDESDNGAAVPAPAAESGGLAGRALDVLAKSQEDTSRRLERALEQRDRQPVAPAFDWDMIDRITAPLKDTIAALERRLDSQGKPTAAEASATTVTERLLDRMITDDSARMKVQREAYESEIRVLKENAREDDKRIRDEALRDRDRLISDHNREVSNLKSNHEAVLTSVKGSLDLQVRILEAEKARLEREIAELKVEVKDLRAKKEKGPIELAKDYNELQKAFGGGDDKEDKGTILGLVDTVANSKMGSRFIERVMSGEDAPPQGGQQMIAPAVGQPFRGHDGQLYVNNGAAIVPYRKRKKKAAAAPAAPTPPQEEGSEAPPPAAPNAPMPDLDPDTVKMAVSLLTSAYQAGRDPKEMASSAKTMVGQDVLNFIGTHGVDPLLDKVAGLDRSSPLAQQAGRNWVRKVAKALLGD